MHSDAVPRNYSQLVSKESAFSTAILTLSISDEFIDVMSLDPFSPIKTFHLTSVVNLILLPCSILPKMEVALFPHL